MQAIMYLLIIIVEKNKKMECMNRSYAQKERERKKEKELSTSIQVYAKQFAVIPKQKVKKKKKKKANLCHYLLLAIAPSFTGNPKICD